MSTIHTNGLLKDYSTSRQLEIASLCNFFALERSTLALSGTEPRNVKRIMIGQPNCSRLKVEVHFDSQRIQQNDKPIDQRMFL